MRFASSRLTPLSLTLLWILLGGAESGIAQTPQRKKPEESVSLSTMDDHESIRHRIVNQQYEVSVRYEKSMLGMKKLDLSITSQEQGDWSESVVTSGSLLSVKHAGGKEPRKCTVESKYANKKDPAGDFEAEMIKRAGGNVVNSDQAKQEISRLVDQYGQADHVLKLPRFAGSRTDYEDTLRRLSRWVAYDKLFVALNLDARPVATQTTAKETYDQALVLLKGGELPTDPEQRRISDEEVERIGKAFEFVYEIKFTPHLAPKEVDQNWRHAGRVSFRNGEIGRVLWQGELHPGRHSSSWLGYQPKKPGNKIQVNNASQSKDVHWVLVEGENGWSYLRAVNTSKKTTRFQLKVIDNQSASEVQITHTRSPDLRFPF